MEIGIKGNGHYSGKENGARTLVRRTHAKARHTHGDQKAELTWEFKLFRGEPSFSASEKSLRYLDKIAITRESVLHKVCYVRVRSLVCTMVGP